MTLRGAKSPEQILLSVGAALTWWEGCEDTLIGIYRVLRARSDPASVSQYIRSSRRKRVEMLRVSLDLYPSFLSHEEIKLINLSLIELDELSKRRNEIAHGHCSHQTRSENGIVVIDGCLLVSALHEGKWIERDQRFAYDVERINAFSNRVRAIRKDVSEILYASLSRAQDQGHLAIVFGPSRDMV